jgi:predicted acetyltransferase
MITTRTDVEIRPLTEDDLPAAAEMNRIAFGGLRRPADETERPAPQPASTIWGMFDSGRLVAKAGDRQQQHWFGGRPVPASGLAGVASSPEWRGGGNAAQLLTRVLAEARARGAAICTLYRAVPGVYRRLGWEDTGVSTWMSYPTLGLSGLRVPKGSSVRPAGADDLPILAELYRRTAAEGNALLERSGPLFAASPQETLDRYDGITLAEGPDGEIDGYACWQRGTGYAVGARLSVAEFVARTGAAATTLLANLASWGNALPTMLIWQPVGDRLSWAMPVDGTHESLHAWMLRIIDAPAAVAARGWRAGVSGSVDLELADDVCPWNAGRWRLTVEDGQGRLEAGGSGAVSLNSRGLALLYAGGVSLAALRRAGLAGGESTSDAFVEAVIGGPTPTLLDTF